MATASNTEPAQGAEGVRYPKDECLRQIARLRKEIAITEARLTIWERRLNDGEVCGG